MVLTTKYSNAAAGKDPKAAGNQRAADGRFSSEMMKDLLPDAQREARIVQALRKVGEQAGQSPAPVALAWLRHRSVPVIPIVGASKLSQFGDHLASLTLTLSPEQVRALDEASRIDPAFRYSMYGRDLKRSFAYGGVHDRILPLEEKASQVAADAGGA